MAKKTMTAPLARIVVPHPSGQGTLVIGKMRDIRVTETIRRGRVSGLGELNPHELPALEWNGTLTCRFHFIDLSGADNDASGIPGAMPRVANLATYISHILLQEEGLQIQILKKVKGTINAQGLIEENEKPQVVATINGAFADRESFDISEGQISGHDQDFTYITPILFTP